jgi:hypothetical protein
MTSSKEFLLSLRQIIREEVQLAIRSEFSKQAISESKTATKAITGGSLNTTPSKARNAYQGSLQPQKQKSPNTTAASKPIKQYVKNPELNDILNSVGSFASEGPRAYMETEEVMNESINLGTVPAVVTDIDGRRISTEALAQTEAGAAVLNALTRDYSSLMKAIDKKQGK